MNFEAATQTMPQLRAALKLKKARHRPHGNARRGKLYIALEAFAFAGSETNICISPFSTLDCTANIHIGNNVCLHEKVIALCQITEKTDGTVTGARAALTKNPGPFETWAGVAARKIADRRYLSPSRFGKMLLGPLLRYNNT